MDQTAISVFIDHNRLVAQVWKNEDDKTIIDVLVTPEEAKKIEHKPVYLDLDDDSIWTFKCLLDHYNTPETIVVYKWNHHVSLRENVEDRFSLLLKRLMFWKR